MKTTNAIALSLVLASFALLGTWAGTQATVRTTDSLAGNVAGAAGSTPCPYEDQTGGVGGQSGSCTFSCGPGTISLSVSADDSDAGVSGSGSCGDGDLHCNGDGSCGDSTAVSTGGDGSCSGDSDEAIDSGLYVSCSGEAKDVGDVQIPPVCKNVGLSGPRICGYDLDVRDHAGVLPLRACLLADLRADAGICTTDRSPADLFNDTRVIENAILHKFWARNATASAHLFVQDGLAAGLVCWGLDCKQVFPVCSPILATNITRCQVR